MDVLGQAGRLLASGQDPRELLKYLSDEQRLELAKAAIRFSVIPEGEERHWYRGETRSYRSGPNVRVTACGIQLVPGTAEADVAFSTISAARPPWVTCPLCVAARPVTAGAPSQPRKGTP